jgi:hypothetical protein
LAEHRVNIQALDEEIGRALAGRIAYRRYRYDEMSYREEIIREHWEPYFAWMNTHPKHLFFGWLKEFYRDLFVAVADATNAAEFYDFGVMCGQPDYEAAKLRRRVRFVGVDRQKTTARLNTNAYRTTNIEFRAAEIEDVLSELPNDGTPRVLFHGRAATLCYPEKIRQLYRLCARKRVRAIALFENYSPSHALYRFLKFDEFPADSIIYKNDQFIHNYPKLLAEAGYEIVKQQVMFSPLITPFSNIDLGSTHAYVLARLKA